MQNSKEVCTHPHEDGFLAEAFNLELASFHPSLEQLREYKRMKKLQRDVALAHLELMHLAAEGLTALDIIRGSEPGSRTGPRRRALAQTAGRDRQVPVFTSQAAREAWEAEQGQEQVSGYGSA